MEFTNEDLGVAFSLPEPLTLGDVEAWEKGMINATKAGAVTPISVRWMGARPIICNWVCEALPNHEMEANKISNEELRIVAWAGFVVEQYIQGLTQISKN